MSRIIRRENFVAKLLGKALLLLFFFCNRLTSRTFLKFKIIPTRHLLYALLTQFDENKNKQCV